MKKFIQAIHREDIIFLMLSAAYILISCAVTLILGKIEYFRPMLYLFTGFQISLTLFTGYVLYRLIRALYIVLALRPEHPEKALWDDLRQGPLNPLYARRALPIFIGFIFFFSTFTSMKELIAHLHPFAWDEFFMQTDRTIHFGTDPWRWLQPVLGHPVITQIIAFIYVFWLPLFFGVLYWQLFRLKDEALRMRFFYTFLLTWAVNGTFLAIAFSSAGPCYYDKVVGSDIYLPLMEYLRSANEHFDIYAVTTQDMLWQNYLGGLGLKGGGISAFPSVHVATAFLFVLMARHVNRPAFIFFLIFFVFILVGSVHLGWHYAVDGYFSVITTAALWIVSKKRGSE